MTQPLQKLATRHLNVIWTLAGLANVISILLHTVYDIPSAWVSAAPANIALPPATMAAQSSDPFAPCIPQAANAIVCENSKQGTPAGQWDIFGAGDDGIQGFATEISVN